MNYYKFNKYLHRYAIKILNKIKNTVKIPCLIMLKLEELNLCFSLKSNRCIQPMYF